MKSKLVITIQHFEGRFKDPQQDIIERFSNDVSSEFDEIRVDTHIFKLRCWCACSVLCA